MLLSHDKKLGFTNVSNLKGYAKQGWKATLLKPILEKTKICGIL